MLHLWGPERLVFAPHRDGVLWHGPSTSLLVRTPGLFGASPLVLTSVTAQRRHATLLNWAGRDVFVVDDRRRAFVAASLYRDSRHDRQQSRTLFVEDHDDLVIAYEHGILCLDGDRRTRWKVDHDDTAHLFSGLEGGVAWYESTREGRWGYRLDDGSRV
jgi:hypothetical protein